MNEAKILAQATRLDLIGQNMAEETTDTNRLAEIANVRTMLTCILSGLLSEDDDKVITLVSRRLTYLQRNKGSSGKHSLNPNPLNDFKPLKR